MPVPDFTTPIISFSMRAATLSESTRRGAAACGSARSLPCAVVMDLSSRGSFLTPPPAMAEAMSAMCMGVASTRPCPMEDQARSSALRSSMG